MSIKLKPAELTELRPRITVIGVGGAGGNAVNNMIQAGLEGVEFVAANTDAQALSMSSAGIRIQMGVNLTEGLGAGSKPEIGAAAAEEALDEIRQYLEGVHMLFITAGMGGGTGTGAAPIIAQAAKDMGILTVAVVTKPFEFEGQRRMRFAEQGIAELSKHVDTIIVIPNQNLFRIANEKTTFADAFQRADDVLRSGVSCITDLMIKEGLINLDFADVRVVMREMGTAMMGTGESDGEKRALEAAEAAISNPLLDDISMQGAKGLLISITGGYDLTLYEVEEAASRIRREVDPEANPDMNIIVGATFDHALEGRVRVSVVATGITRRTAEHLEASPADPALPEAASLASRLRSVRSRESTGAQGPAPATERDEGGEPQPWRGPGSVTIEQRPQRRDVRGAPLRSATSSEAPREPFFEPAPPPAMPRRKPRRPLTADDFPELADQNAGSQDESEADHRSRKKGGFFDWVAGRNRNKNRDGTAQVESSDRSGAGAPATLSEPSLQTGKPGAPLVHRPKSRLAPEPEEDRQAKASGGPENGSGTSEEPFDIPDFFKRPLN